MIVITIHVDILVSIITALIVIINTICCSYYYDYFPYYNKYK